jgi:hypothetical protein
LSVSHPAANSAAAHRRKASHSVCRHAGEQKRCSRPPPPAAFGWPMVVAEEVLPAARARALRLQVLFLDEPTANRHPAATAARQGGARPSARPGA